MVLQNYQNIIEMTSNMIYTVALGGGFKCPRKIHLNTNPLVEIELTDLTKSGGANATLPPGSAGPVYLLLRYRVQPYILTWTPVGGFYPLASISQCAILLQFVSQPKASII